MNFAVDEGNPDERVRIYVLELRKKENACRRRAEEAAKCGKRDTAQNAIISANRYASGEEF